MQPQPHLGQTLEQIRAVRIEKMKKLRALGFDPYPARCTRTTAIAPLKQQYDTHQGKSFVVTGRIMSFRIHGKLSFATLADETSSIQLYLKDEHLATPQERSLTYAQIHELMDMGDFVEAHGALVKTKTGEISIEVKRLLIITKALRPLPEKWQGLKDQELRQRKRYLDMTMNPDIRERFRRRSVFWQEVRAFLIREGFVEVNIPVLELTTGGADAKPFRTHMDSIDQDYFLRISHELPLKRLIGGGFEKVFDIGPRFRNEGFSDEHLPEHIAMEFYWAYADYKMGMELTQRMLRHVLTTVYQKTAFDMKGFHVSIDGDWPMLDYAQAIKDRFAVDIYTDSAEQLLRVVQQHRIDFTGEPNRNRLIDTLWKDVRRTIAGPVFLVNEPKFLSPLAKTSPDDSRVTERFHVIIAGSELVNAFSELNDPIDQFDRFQEQQELRESGDQEAMMMDHDFIEMLEQGMPPAFGLGISERVFWFFEGVTAREGVPFPPMKEEKAQEEKTAVEKKK